MEHGKPSRTAWGAAAHRAAHQVLEGGQIFADPLALRILGWDAEAARHDAARKPGRGLRLFIAVRTHFAENACAAAHARGVRQLVVLGAGLDTYAYRTTLADGLRIFEVDHPATQAWKRQLLAAAGIAEPPSLTYVPVDFERRGARLAEGLAGAGFDARRPVFLMWLGVVPYLTEASVLATLAWVAGLPAAGEIVFDYTNPAGDGDPGAAAMRALAARVAAAGEPFRAAFETAALHARLRAMGFADIEDLGPVAICSRYFGIEVAPAGDTGGHVLRAATTRPAPATAR